MDVEFDGTGVIARASRDSAVVSLFIDSALKEFSFSKTILYTFGVKCDGDLDNIVDVGTKVNLSYKLIQWKSRCVVTAVWIGKKPDCLNQGELNKSLPSNAIYNAHGNVSYVMDDDNVLVRCDDSCDSVLVNKSVVYRNGCLLENDQFKFVVGDGLTFDAIPFDNESEHFSGAAFQATCAWLDEDVPCLFDRFLLQGKEFTASRRKRVVAMDSHVEGTVSIIVNDIVAVVDVRTDYDFGKVLLFRSSFGRTCKRLQDYVDVGDVLNILLQQGCIFPGRKQWFAVQAERPSYEMRTGGISEHNGGSAPSVNLSPVTTVLSHLDFTGTVATPQNGGVQFDEKSPFLFSDPPLSGVISGNSLDSAYISYKTLKIFVKRSQVYLFGSLCTVNQFFDLVSSGEIFVNFEAALTSCARRQKFKITHDATCVWLGKKPSYCVPQKKPYSSPPNSLRPVAGNDVFEEGGDDSANLNGSAAITSMFDAMPLKKSYPTASRSMLLGCIGILRFREYRGVQILEVEHVFGTSTPIRTVVYGFNDDMPIDPEMASHFNGHEVLFDAELNGPVTKSAAFLIKRMWTRKCGRPSPERYLSRALMLEELVTFSPTELYRGTITSVPFHDCAIAEVNSVPILVTLQSLVTSEKANASYTSVDGYLGIGDMVCLKVEGQNRVDVHDFKYYRASKCWKSGAPVVYKGTGDEVEVSVPQEVSWFSLRGYGERFRKGRLERRCNRYFVSLKSSKNSGLDWSLDVFERGSFFVNGVLTEPRNIEKFNGQEICFYVGHEYSKHLRELPGDGLFVICSWIGKEPDPWMVLREKLAIPKGFVTKDMFYEGVVEDFPLRTHAICRVGHIPVLVPLEQIEVSEEIEGVDFSLTKGARLTMRIEEVAYEPNGPSQHSNRVFLLSSKTSRYVCDWPNVVYNLKGVVVDPPNPLGTIQVNGADIIITFELCVVQIKDKSFEEKETQAWARLLKDCVQSGTEVSCTVTCPTVKTAPFRALEVWIKK